MADRREPPPPVVTVSGGDVLDGEPPRERRVPAVLLAVLAGAAVLAVALQGASPPPPPRPAPPPLSASLAVAGDAVQVSLSGVVVVPVELTDGGAGLSVESATAYAEPVRDDPSTSPPVGVPPGASRRFVVLLAPDCRLLTPRAGLRFRASLLMTVANGEQDEQLFLDLAGEPAVASSVAGLCGSAGGALSDRR